MIQQGKGNPFRSKPPRSAQRGAALVIVLSIILLIVIVAIGLLSRARTERQASAAFTAASMAKQLFDNTVNIAIGQIRSGTDHSVNPVWISQPGLLRTFTQDGEALKNYKLYSATKLVSQGDFDLAEDLPPADWKTKSHIYVDINAPTLVPGPDGDYTPEGSPSSERFRRVYPILNASGLSKIEGFSLTSPPGASTLQPAPMPVRWLYMLQDGTVVPPESTSANTAKIAGASATNPIIGRVAFWTDDETCKVNLNTASFGTYWDTPRAFTESERDRFSRFQPANKEFQRYPGHPAMTSLKPIFGHLFTGNDSAFSEFAFSIAPRIASGGSMLATKTTDDAKPVVLDSDRLYTSVDELIFRSDTRERRTPLTREDIEASRFFLTTRSRAPEVTLFDTPRVSIWPINKAPLNTSATDRLLAFSSTAGNYPYYFQRANPNSSTSDYLDIPRNQEIYSYLQRMTDQTVPGFGGSFSAKYGQDRDQILTEMVDYIRCTNLSSTADGASSYTSFGSPGQGQVVPLRIGATKGFGRFPTISEAFIHFYRSSMPGAPATVSAIVYFEMFDPMQGYVTKLPNFSIRCEFTGFTIKSPPANTDTPLNFQNASVDVVGGTTIPSLFRRPAYNYGGSDYGGIEGFSHLFYDRNIAKAGANIYPFVSDPVPYSDNPTDLQFGGGTVVVTLMEKASGEAVQSFDFEFPAGTFPPILGFNDPSYGDSYDMTKRISVNDTLYSQLLGGRFFNPLDVVRSLEPSLGDKRLLAAKPLISASDFTPHADYSDPAKSFADSARTTTKTGVLGTPTGASSNYRGSTFGKIIDVTSADPSDVAGQTKINSEPDVPSRFPNGIQAGLSLSFAPDFDNGLPDSPDDAYVNKPDEGDSKLGATGIDDTAYFFNTENNSTKQNNPTFFSPNRQVPSPLMFGSLPTGVKANKPWQTLLFRPDPGSHPGATSPVDCLMLDLFWMPVAEPYAISEPFSTAGKINLNSQIVPFTYIKRDTGLRAVLEATQIIAIPDSDAAIYKGRKFSKQNYRIPIDMEETLRPISERLDSGKPILSPTEICNFHLIPTGQTKSSIQQFWNTHRITGDNSKEKPYAEVYPRLTTQSNAFKIFIRVQTLKHMQTGDQSIWREDVDKVIGEYRGSSYIERVIDPNKPEIPDFATDSSASLFRYYKIRAVSPEQFCP